MLNLYSQLQFLAKLRPKQCRHSFSVRPGGAITKIAKYNQFFHPSVNLLLMAAVVLDGVTELRRRVNQGRDLLVRNFARNRSCAYKSILD